ncbi:hypothetical protein NDU88_005836 [Pleurodeles waltl]|uniref:Uncharacterized protein n=1 Tax=Pleurodeles waltl TaxID=8319 RepID=A0AAV7QIB0_PLEWA|nr:hypothetical protein NDU88_005836 [Pleurodeles waltl]
MEKVCLRRRVSHLFRVARICVPFATLPKPRGERSSHTGAGGRIVGRSAPMPVFAAARAKGGRASYRKSSRGASLHRGWSATAARAPDAGLRSVLCSPHGISGESASALRRTSAPPPTPIPQTCSGAAQEGSDAPPAPPPSSRGLPPRGARLSGGHPGSWPDHAPSCINLKSSCFLCTLRKVCFYFLEPGLDSAISSLALFTKVVIQ